MTRALSRQKRMWAIQVVHISDPPIDSPASLALLTKKYCMEDKNLYTEYRMKRLRDKWMKLQMKTPDELGGLTCACCGRKGLSRSSKGGLHNLATLDHKLEIGLGGVWNDPNNFQVLCGTCHRHKNDLLVSH